MSKQRKAEAVLNEPYENQIVKQRTLFQETWMRFRRSKTAMFGLCFLLVLVVISVGTLVIDLVSNNGVYDAYVVAQDPVNRLQGPSGAHILGMDELGRDIAERNQYMQDSRCKRNGTGCIQRESGGDAHRHAHDQFERQTGEYTVFLFHYRIPSGFCIGTVFFRKKSRQP